MKDSKGNKLKKGDTVKCHGLEFVIKSFQNMPSGELMACGEYGCFNVSILEKVMMIIRKRNENRTS